LFQRASRSSGSGGWSRSRSGKVVRNVAELGGREVVEPGDDGIDFGAQTGAFPEVEGGLGQLDFGVLETRRPASCAFSGI
jgi:hypothetical protein